MKIAKFRIWDATERKWFETIYNRNTGELKEMFLSQNGELFLHERDAQGKESITPQTAYAGEPSRYEVVFYSGIKDREGKRFFFGDFVRFTDKGGRYSYGVLLWDRDMLAIGSGHVGDYTAIDQLYERDLRAADCVGNIYQDPEFLNSLPTTQQGHN